LTPSHTPPLGPRHPEPARVTINVNPARITSASGNLLGTLAARLRPEGRSPLRPLVLLQARFSARSAPKGVLAFSLTVVATLILSATPALATRAAHAFAKSFGTQGSAAGQLNLRATATGLAGSGLAVGEATGDVYVADTENHRVDVFDPSKPAGEEFLRAWGWGVADGKPELEVCTTTCQAGLSGSAPGEFEAPAFVAVDNSPGGEEDVYVGDTGDDTVSKFTPAGGLIESWGVKGQLSESTATGSGDLSAGAGTGDLSAATGKGNLTAGSEVVTGLTTSAGAFKVGQVISGPGIPGETTILAIPGPTELKLSQPAEGEGTEAALQAGSTKVTAVVTSTPEFLEGQTITGPGIPAGTTIKAVLSPTELELSQPAIEEETTAALTAGSDRITEVFTTGGFFTVGQTITGAGIPAGTTVTGTPEPGVIEVSKLPEAAGVAVELTAHRSFAPLAGITVSPTGTLDVLSTAGGFFQFEASGTLLAPEISIVYVGTQRAEPRGIAVDVLSGGFFETTFNGDGEKHHPFERSAEGGAVTEVDAEANAIASDTSDLFVAEAGLVKTFPLAGLSEATPPSESFGSGTLVASAGVAVDGSHEDTVFVSDAATGRVDVFAPEAAAAPLVVGEAASEVGDDSATFTGEVNPRSLPGEEATTYEFRYGVCTTASTCASAGFPETSPAGSLAPSFEVEPVGLSEPVKGLLAGRTYHYELVASNAHGVGAVREQVFTTHGTGAFVLPDARQWQLVSPTDKQGALIEAVGGGGDGGEGAATQAAAAGGAITYLTGSPTDTGPSGYDNFVQVLSRRGAAGWQTRDLTVPHAGQAELSVGNGQEYRFFSEDLSRTAVQPFGVFTPCENAGHEPQPCISLAASAQTSFIEDTQTALFTPLVTACPATGVCPKAVEEDADVPPGTIVSTETSGCPADAPCGPAFVGGSPDLTHAVVAYAGLSEWSAAAPAGERLQPVSLLPPNAHGDVLAAETPVLGYEAGSAKNARGAVSKDGSRVAWEGGSAGVRHLYLRLNATRPQSATSGEHCTEPEKACTVQLDTGLTGTPEFQDASSEITRAFFTDGGDLYSYDVEDATLEEPLAEGVEGVIAGSSEDGTYVYFVAGDTMYLDYLEGTSWTQTPVAGLSGGDAPDWGGPTGVLRKLTARVSPDGRWLAFMSQAPLTGYDNTDAVSGKPDEEVYLYHAGEHPATEPGTLTCASCNPTGARPHGIEYGVEGSEGIDSMPLAGGFFIWPGTAWLAANIPPWTASTRVVAPYQSRYLSNSGRLFFNSIDGLVPKDVDGTVDVYEYEPAGVPEGEHACSPATSNGGEVYEPEHETTPGVSAPAGCVALISSGASSGESAFLDASEPGGDVFFLSSDKLTASKEDTSLDVFDAHECTTLSPCLPEAASAPPPCDTEASCKAAPTPQPELFGPSGSATFNGPGNPAPLVAPVVRKAKVLTRAQKLAKALKVCKEDRRQKKRVACERVARKRYGVVRKRK
jgi:hypothetical protein